MVLIRIRFRCQCFSIEYLCFTLLMFFPTDYDSSSSFREWLIFLNNIFINLGGRRLGRNHPVNLICLSALLIWNFLFFKHRVCNCNINQIIDLIFCFYYLLVILRICCYFSWYHSLLLFFFRTFFLTFFLFFLFFLIQSIRNIIFFILI